METKIRAEFGAALVNAAFKHHTRKGIRSDCYCEWCYRKRQANAEFYIDYMRRRGLVKYKLAPPYRCWDDYDDVRFRAILAARRQTRMEIRKDLYQIYPRPEYDPAF